MTHVNGKPVLAATDIYKVLEKPGSVKMTVARSTETIELIIQPEEA